MSVPSTKTCKNAKNVYDSSDLASRWLEFFFPQFYFPEQTPGGFRSADSMTLCHRITDWDEGAALCDKC